MGVATSANRAISEYRVLGNAGLLASLGVYTWPSKEKSLLSSPMTNPLVVVAVSVFQAQPYRGAAR